MTELTSKKKWIGESFLYHCKYLFLIYPSKFYILIEHFLGISMSWHLSYNSFIKQFHLKYIMTQINARINVINKFHQDLLKQLNSDQIRVDDVIDFQSGHRLIHFATIFDDDFLIDYLIENQVHLMARDYNGCTALHKGASLGRLSIVKKLIENGVPLNHTDRWGKTALDQAKIHNQHQIIEYLENLPKNMNSDKIKIWKEKKFNEKYMGTNLILKLCNNI